MKFVLRSDTLLRSKFYVQERFIGQPYFYTKKLAEAPSAMESEL